MEHEINPLPFYTVDVAEEDARVRSGVIRCEIGRTKNLEFSTAGLESYCFATWKPVVFDALLLAAAVEFCDRTLRRPSRGWGRDIRLRLPVHDVNRWQAVRVVNALADALSTLTGDRWNVQFRPRKREAQPPRQGQFSLPAGASAVIPFSDGMDSWSGAAIAGSRLGTGLLRVRLGSRKLRRTHHDYKQPFAYVPYQVRAGNCQFLQNGGRSRGFKFALISGIAAYLAGVVDVIIPESGQGALGPALVAVGPAYPDYRSHPLFMARMQRFLHALLEHKVIYRFPHLWQTKGETLRIAASDKVKETSWVQTRSCWQSSRQVSVDGTRRQCGVCAACMLRRLSVQAAGLEEPCDAYVWENINSRTFESGAAPSFSNFTVALREYAIAGTLHLDHLAALVDAPIHSNALKRHALQLSQVLGEPRMHVEAQLLNMLKKHREEWDIFISSLGPESFVVQWLGGSS